MATTKTPPKKAKKPAAKPAAKGATKAAAKDAPKATAKAAPKVPAPRGKGPGGEVVLTRADLLELVSRLGEVVSILKAAVEAFDGKQAVIRPTMEFVMFLKPIPGADRQKLINNC